MTVNYLKKPLQFFSDTRKTFLKSYIRLEPNLLLKVFGMVPDLIRPELTVWYSKREKKITTLSFPLSLLTFSEKPFYESLIKMVYHIESKKSGRVNKLTCFFQRFSHVFAVCTILKYL